MQILIHIQIRKHMILSNIFVIGKIKNMEFQQLLPPLHQRLWWPPPTQLLIYDMPQNFDAYNVERLIGLV